MVEERKEAAEITWTWCPECKILTPMIQFVLTEKEDIPKFRCLNCLVLFERKLTIAGK